MSILELTGFGLILLAPFCLVMLTPLLSTGLRFWLWGWAITLLTGPLQVAALEYPNFIFLGQAAGVVFPMCMLAGTFGFLNRPVPRWLLWFAITAVLLRSGIAAIDQVMLARLIVLPMEIFALVLAAWHLNREPDQPKLPNIALGVAMTVLAGMEVWDTTINDQMRQTVASGIPWAITYAFTGAIQIWAWLDKARRERSATLRSAQERFDALANHADDIIVEIDSNAEFVYVSPNCLKVLGITTQEMIGKRIDEFMRQVAAEHQGEEFHFEHPDSLQKIAEAGPYGKLYKVRHTDGSPRFLEITASHYFNSQGEIRAVGVVRDITQRVEEEQSNLSRQKLESLGTMSAGIAHDFRNLLTTIRGSTELLQLDLSENDAAHVNRHITNVLSASDQAAGLTDQLLTYAGKTPLAMSDINLARIVSDSAPLLKTVVADRAHLYINLDDDIPQMQGNRVALQQILINLVTNAAEALPAKDGKIWVSVNTRANDSGQTLVDLKVSDNGRGMEESTKTHIFEPFFTTKFAGRGLGLAAIQGLVTAHNGLISVDSFPDQGATFIITFPGSQQNQKAGQAFGG